MNECSFEALLFEYNHPEDFYKIVGQKSNRFSIILILFRISMVLYCYTIGLWWLCQLFLASELKLYNSYCTWAQVVWSITAEFGLIKTLHGIRKFNLEGIGTRLPWYVKIYWCLFSATLPSVVLSFIIFWSQMSYESVHNLYIFMGNVTPFLSLLEFVLVAFPLRIINFFYFLILGFLYIKFTYIYQDAGGQGINDTPWIYKDLDWRDPSHAILTSLIALFIGETAYVIFWFISKIKLSKWCCGNRVVEN